MSSPGTCASCPTSEAICLGGSQIGPKAGYWRSSNTSSNFIKCLNTAACLGMISPDYNPDGSCATGYQGILCSSCQPGYSTTGTFTCSLCPNESANVLRLTGILIGAIIIVVFMIRSTLNGALEVRNVTSIYQKIILNHVQLIVLTASFNFNWPDLVTSFFNASQPVGQASTQIISVDCFINTQAGAYTSNGVERSSFPIRLFYFKLVLYAAMPFSLMLFSYLVWGFISLKNQNKKLVMIKATSTVVILLFLVHPNLVNYIFNVFNCITIDTQQRVKNDLEIVCYQGQHFFWSMAVALPALIVWGLGIPAFGFMLMFKERKRLNSVEARQKFGFLFRGYKQRFYYWEIVVMYRKVALIFIQVFLVQYGSITQALVVFLLLIGFVILSMKKKPFQTETLNNLETVSLVVCMVTIFCGIFFIVDIQSTNTTTGQTSNSSGVYLSQGTQLFFFFTIVLSNIFFFLYWIVKMYQELQNMIIKKFGKIYTILCLCGNHKKYKDLLEVTMIQEENEILREGYMDSLRQLKDLYNSGILVLNKKVLEKVKFYLRPEKVLLAGGVDPLQEQKEMDELRKKRNLRIKKDKEQQKHIKDNSDDVNLHFYDSPQKSGCGEVEQNIKRKTSELSLSNDDDVDYEEGVPEDNMKDFKFHKQDSLFIDNYYSKMPSLVGSVRSSAAPRLPLQKTPIAQKGQKQDLQKQYTDSKRQTMDLDMDNIEQIEFDNLQKRPETRETEKNNLKEKFYSKIRPQNTKEIQDEDEQTLIRENSITKKAVMILTNMRKQQSNDDFIIKQIKDPQTSKHRDKLRQVMENNLISEDGRKGYHKLRQKKANRKITYSMPQLTMKIDEDKKDEEEGRVLTITSQSARGEEVEESGVFKESMSSDRILQSDAKEKHGSGGKDQFPEPEERQNTY